MIKNGPTQRSTLVIWLLLADRNTRALWNYYELSMENKDRATPMLENRSKHEIQHEKLKSGREWVSG